MRNKKLLAGMYNVYTTFDKISKHYKSIYFASNDEDFVRKYLPSIILEIPLRELQIFKIGNFNDVTGEISKTVKKRVQTDCYFFPKTRLSPTGDDLTHEEIESSILETKNKILADSAEESENENMEE